MIDLIAGTSMGAAMGAAKAIGADLRKFARLVSSLDLNDLLQVSDNTMREVQRAIGRGMAELVRGPTWRRENATPENLARMLTLFELLTARKRFEDAVVPFAVVAADVETGARVVLDKGHLYEAVCASAAIPGIFSPVPYGDRYLIDGGVIEKIPVDVVIERGAEAVIAVDTSAPLTRSVTTSFDALLQSQRITSQRLTELQLASARTRLNDRFLMVRPNVQWITMFAFEHVAEAIQIGRETALGQIDAIRSLVVDAAPS